jgi:stage III sporulation protein AB
MLFKITGSVIVVLSCAFLGLVMSADIRKRPQQLRELQGMLQMFENQICYLSDVLTEAFERICRVSSSETGIFFRSTIENLNEEKSANASEAWRRAVTQNIKKTALNKEDEEVLLDFGKMLGSSDLEGQIKNIRLTQTKLSIQEKKAEDSRCKNEKMYKSLGLLGGIAVVIVLI